MPSGQTAGPQRLPRLGWVIAFLAAAILIGVVWIGFSKLRPRYEAPLPVLATVPDFSFTSQEGKPIARQDLLGKIWVADFIFTRCAGPCPIMSGRMADLQTEVAKGGDDVRLVSVTVDPEYDTPPVLADYGKRFGADPARWKLLTGDPGKVREFITKGMLLPLARDKENVPIHSQKFVVIDAQGRIRSFHDLEDPELIPKVLVDIGNLVRESHRDS